MLTVEKLAKSYRSSGARRRARRNRGRDAGESVFAISDISFSVEKGELFTLLGPSGCGKTTTLRSVAGLEKPESGSIALAGRTLFDGATKVHVSSERRGIGMVFQSYAIWPHMTVFKNVAFPLEVQRRSERRSRAQIAEDVQRALEATELAEYASRPATKLSGGQQQRLALARALVSEPALILLDEPLSNLDAKLRESMRFELKRLQRERGVTSIYVTHDQTEALALSNRIAVMNNGHIEQIGRPREIYDQPASRFVAAFVGTSNFIDGVVGETTNGRTAVKTDHGILWSRPAESIARGDEVLVSIRPEAMSISSAAPPPGPHNVLTGKVASRGFVGDAIDYIVAVDDREFRVKANPGVRLGHAPEVFLCIEDTDVVIVPR